MGSWIKYKTVKKAQQPTSTSSAGITSGFSNSFLACSQGQSSGILIPPVPFPFFAFFVVVSFSGSMSDVGSGSGSVSSSDTAVEAAFFSAALKHHVEGSLGAS